MTTIVEFKLKLKSILSDGYNCDHPMNMSGDYVPLAEYQELKALIQRVNEIGPNLFDLVWFEDYQTDESPELMRLLKDCKEAL